MTTAALPPAQELWHHNASITVSFCDYFGGRHMFTVCLKKVTMGKHVPIETKHFIGTLAKRNWTPYAIWKFLSDENLKQRTVKNIVSKFRKTGTVKRKAGSGRKPIKQAVREKIVSLSLSQEQHPGQHLSQRKVSKYLSVSQQTVSNVLRKYGLKCYKRYVSNHVSFGARERRLERCKKLLRNFNDADMEKMVFQDEADLTLQIPINRQNNRFYSLSKKNEVHPSRLYHATSTFSKKIMVSAAVSVSGKSELFFIDPQKTKVNADVYIDHLDKQLLPSIRKVLKSRQFFFMQDNAPSHSAKKTQAFLETAAPNFLHSTDWPPSSPDLNPLDYHVWNALKVEIYSGRTTPFKNIDELKTIAQQAWKKLPQDGIRKAVLQWRSRVKQVVKNNGGYIRNSFK